MIDELQCVLSFDVFVFESSLIVLSFVFSNYFYLSFELGMIIWAGLLSAITIAWSYKSEIDSTLSMLLFRFSFSEVSFYDSFITTLSEACAVETGLLGLEGVVSKLIYLESAFLEVLMTGMCCCVNT